jgi:hypothetical protein
LPRQLGDVGTGKRLFGDGTFPAGGLELVDRS